jgi:hypothetical protein
VGFSNQGALLATTVATTNVVHAVSVDRLFQATA